MDQHFRPSFHPAAQLNITCSSTKQVTISEPEDDNACMAESGTTCSLRFDTIKYHPSGNSAAERSDSGISSRFPVAWKPSASRRASGDFPLTANQDSEKPITANVL